jgi:general nucleoside transport system ATP-binding protein
MPVIASSLAPQPSALVATDLSKKYGELPALADVSVAFASGEIHAVLGENGAGKSTLVGILSGFVSPSSGRVTLDEREVPMGRAFECRRLGIEMIHQHFTLVPDFTVEENLALARLPGLAVSANVAERARPSLDAARRLSWPIDPKARVSSLAVGERQRLEILKALGGVAKVLVLDEPTAVLSRDEVEDLFRVLRQLRDEGRIVILIAHKLSEVLAVADRISVLRKGRLVVTIDSRAADAALLSEWMVGALPAASERLDVGAGVERGLEVHDFKVMGDRSEPAVRGVGFAVGCGEIVGIGGVDGNGQVELAEAVAGIRAITSGTMTWRGGQTARNSPTIGYIPQDRQVDGLGMTMSVEENLLVGALGRSDLRRGPFLRRSEIRRWATELVRRFDIRAGSVKDSVSGLSGGNQQKVVVSRTLDGSPELLVAVNPTRGLDFRATEYVHDMLRGARDAGAAVLLVSTDVDELFALSDRRFFMSRGSLLDGEGAAAYLGGADA